MTPEIMELDPDRARARRGDPPRDPAAFVATHERGVLRWLRALGCPDDRAEEHCQDALLAALHHGMDARPEAAARAWLRTTARNLFLMQVRRERRRPSTATLDEIDTAWLAVRADEDGGDAALVALRACLDLAERRDRDLLEQRYRDGRTRAEMARALAIGEAAIKQALRRARARLQACIEGRIAVTEDGR